MIIIFFIGFTRRVTRKVYQNTFKLELLWILHTSSIVIEFRQRYSTVFIQCSVHGGNNIREPILRVLYITEVVTSSYRYIFNL
jgi:hypothetical protein